MRAERRAASRRERRARNRFRSVAAEAPGFARQRPAPIGRAAAAGPGEWPGPWASGAASRAAEGVMKAPACTSSWHSRHWSTGSWFLAGAAGAAVNALASLATGARSGGVDMGLDRQALQEKSQQGDQRHPPSWRRGCGLAMARTRRVMSGEVPVKALTTKRFGGAPQSELCCFRCKHMSQKPRQFPCLTLNPPVGISRHLPGQAVLWKSAKNAAGKPV